MLLLLRIPFCIILEFLFLLLVAFVVVVVVMPVMFQKNKIKNEIIPSVQGCQGHYFEKADTGSCLPFSALSLTRARCAADKVSAAAEAHPLLHVSVREITVTLVQIKLFKGLKPLKVFIFNQSIFCVRALNPI